MRYFACADDANTTPPPGELCATVVLVESPTVLPPLTVAEGAQIGAAILGVFALAYAAKAVTRMIFR